MSGIAKKSVQSDTCRCLIQTSYNLNAKIEDWLQHLHMYRNELIFRGSTKKFILQALNDTRSWPHVPGCAHTRLVSLGFPFGESPINFSFKTGKSINFFYSFIVGLKTPVWILNLTFLLYVSTEYCFSLSTSPQILDFDTT